MKKLPALLLFAVATLWVGCAESLSGPDATIASRQAIELDASTDDALGKKGRVVESVSGSGTLVENGVGRTFTFQAKRYEDGSVTGEWTRINRDSEHVNNHGTVVCFQIEGNQARIGTLAESGPFEGLYGGFAIQDGDQGNQDDLMSLQYTGFVDVSVAQAYCDGQFASPFLRNWNGQISIRGGDGSNPDADVAHSITGSGNWVENGAVRTFAFVAKRMRDGSVQGQWTRVNHGSNGQNQANHGDIICFSNDGNFARFGTYARTGEQADTYGLFWALDGGQGQNVDQLTLQTVGYPDPDTPLTSCTGAFDNVGRNRLNSGWNGQITFHN